MWPQMINYKVLIYGHKFPQYLIVISNRWGGKENDFSASPIQTYVTHM